MPTLSSDHAQIFFQCYGDAEKPALIFSNSLGTQHSMWHAQIEFFKQDYYIVCYDTRGHGQSSAPQGPYTLEQLGNDVIAVLDHLKIEQADFCGISMGGLTGQWLAIHYPHRFKHVILCNTAAKIGQAQAWLDRAQAVRENGLQSIADSAATRWFTPAFIQNNPSTVQQLSQQLAQGSAEGYASCCEALAHADLTAELSTIEVPVLIIAGQQDPVTTVADGKIMQQKILQSQLFEINASHISNIEQPDAFNQAVQHFIQ